MTADLRQCMRTSDPSIASSCITPPNHTVKSGDHAMTPFTRLFGIATISLLTAAAAAHAQQRRVQVGVLECRGGASVGFIVGSVTNLGCVLRVDGMPEDRYGGAIRKGGGD